MKKYLIPILFLFLSSNAAFAGPNAVRAQTVLDTLVGAPVAPAQSLKVLNAYLKAFGDHLPDGADPATMTNEEKSQFFLQQTKRLIIRLTQNAVKSDQDAAQEAAWAAIEAAVQAEVDKVTL